MKRIFYTTLMFLLAAVFSGYAAENKTYIQYAHNTAYSVEKVVYYDAYGRPVPPPRRHVDTRPAPPAPSYTITVSPAPPPPPKKHVIVKPAPAPTYNVEVRPAPPPPPKR